MSVRNSRKIRTVSVRYIRTERTISVRNIRMVRTISVRNIRTVRTVSVRSTPGGHGRIPVVREKGLQRGIVVHDGLCLQLADSWYNLQ